MAPKQKARNAHVGLLTKIFGNREDEATGADEGAEQSVESSQMHEPDDKAQSQPSPSGDTSNSGSDAVPPEAAKRPSTAQPVPRSQPPRARTTRRNGELQEQRDLSMGRVARPSHPVDAAAKRQPHPASSTVRNLPTGGKVTTSSAGAASARGATRSTPSKAPGAPPSSTAISAPSEARDQADDSEEIDVSDQLEAVDDGDSADDLDASDDLIIDEDEDEETSTNLSARGVVDASADDGSPSVSRDDETDGDVLGLPPGTVSNPRDMDAQQTRRPSETSKTNPDRMSMPSEMKTAKQTLVEAGTEFKGTLKSSCPVAVNGTIDGEIDAPTLNIATSGSILGNVKAKTLRSQGTLSGNVDAEEVFLSGAVRSKTFIKTRRLEMKLGSLDKGQLEVTFGNCDIDLSDV
jgi:cytoskeletal protein CcmA (bactofilin family)